MSYTLEETLKKLNISKYKFNKLRQHRYLNPTTLSEWNGMYYIDVLYISAEEVDKLTPKKLEKIFLKIKKDESNNLLSKWVNKMYKSNSNFLHKTLEIDKSFDFNFETKKGVTDAICSEFDFTSDNFIYLGTPARVDENKLYKVSLLGVYTFNFWENPIFNNNEMDSCLEISVDYRTGNYIVANITVDVFEIENKKTKELDWVCIITNMSDVKSINQECQNCKGIIKIPNEVYTYDRNNKNLCLNCYSRLIRKDRREANRRELLSSNDTIILDFETASLYSTDGIVSISVIDTKGNILINTRIRPNNGIDEGAVRLHGLTLESLKNEKRFDDIKDELINVIKGKTIIVAHNFHEEFFCNLLGVDLMDDDAFECILTMDDVASSCGIRDYMLPKRYNSLADCQSMLSVILNG